jgi:hypothetical protein
MTDTARVTPDGLLRFRGETLRCALGAGGIRADKAEGDGATPVGLLPLRRVLFRADRGPRPATALPAEPIAPEDGWCDDPAHADYNRQVRLPHPPGTSGSGGRTRSMTSSACWAGTTRRCAPGAAARSSSISPGPGCRPPRAASPCPAPSFAACWRRAWRRSR